MDDLEALIRYRKHGVDEKRRTLAALYRQAEEIEKQKQTIAEQVKKETLLAKEMQSAEVEAYLGRYLEGARKKIKALDKSIRQIETRIMVAQEDLRAAFAEVKKVEIVKKNRDDRDKADLKHREDRDLDDIATELHRRKGEE